MTRPTIPTAASASFSATVTADSVGLAGPFLATSGAGATTFADFSVIAGPVLSLAPFAVAAAAGFPVGFGAPTSSAGSVFTLPSFFPFTSSFFGVPFAPIGFRTFTKVPSGFLTVTIVKAPAGGAVPGANDAASTEGVFAGFLAAGGGAVADATAVISVVYVARSGV